MIIMSTPPPGGGVPEYVGSVAKGGSFPPNYADAIQVGPRGAVMVGVHTNNDTYIDTVVVKVGGTTATLIDSAQRWKLFLVTGLSAGTATVEVIWSSPGSNFSGNYAAMSFSNVTSVGIPQVATTTPVTLTNNAKLAVGFWTAGGIRTAAEGDVLRVVSPRLTDGIAIHGTTSDDAIMGLTQPQRGTCLWLNAPPVPLEPVASATNGTTGSATVEITLPAAATVFVAVAGVGGGPPAASTVTSGAITGTQVYTHAGNNIRLTVARFDLPAGTHTITSDSDRAIVAAAYRGTATLGTPVWTNGTTSASVAADMKIAVFTNGGQVSSTTSGTLRATAYKPGGWSCSVSIVEGAQSSISGAEGSVVLPLT
ncbi:hypothetical protein SEA_FINKLE_26 [Gordonia phage Finkle]|uniref:Uncharacterized protein n=1 Tax=Gordonia phage Finkle TaxID=2926099 RepID=A0A9E7SXI0_9CAUD|nr:hypothetical protein QEH33_gp26 [Gordonia phage Finkle]UTN92945.1 hypothetical protein SEA_FINKLE_26 [Gordonia phage Finkle]